VEIPEWLEGLYQRFGEPQVFPRTEDGVRFFDGEVWVTRRFWVWSVKVDRTWINHKIRIDKYGDQHEIVAESELRDSPRVSLKTGPHPTEDQILQVLYLAQFLEVP